MKKQNRENVRKHFNLNEDKRCKIERLTDKWTDTFYEQISNLLYDFGLDYDTEEEELELVDEVIKEMKKIYCREY